MKRRFAALAGVLALAFAADAAAAKTFRYAFQGDLNALDPYTLNETFTLGARLSQKVNLDLLEQPLKKVVVYLDPHEFKSTWLGNKAIYRTRMVMADGGELVIEWRQSDGHVMMTGDVELEFEGRFDPALFAAVGAC